MEKNKRHFRSLPVALLAVILLCALCGAVYGLDRIGFIEIPLLHRTEELPSENGEEIEALLERLSNAEKNGESVFLMLDSSVVIDVLATGKASNNYLHEYSIGYGEGGTAEYSVLRKNSDFHLLEFRQGKLVREVLCVDGNAEVFDARLGQRSVLTGVSGDYFELNSGSISAIDLINFVINFRSGTPTAWKLGTVAECTVETVREESVNMARITLTYSDHTDVYMLDIDRSALYSYETYVGGKKTAGMKTTKISYDIEGLELDSVLN
jgi:hypothetical protein